MKLNSEQDKKSIIDFRVAIDGAPCSGKSTVMAQVYQILLKLGLQKSSEVMLLLWEDAWHKFEPYAHLLLAYFTEYGSITAEHMEEIRQFLEEEQYGSIISDNPEPVERIIRSEVQANGTIRYWHYVNFMDGYKQDCLNFLDWPTPIDSVGELRRMFQANLVLRQAETEARVGMVLDSRKMGLGSGTIVHVCDGGLSGIIDYLPSLSISDYSELCKVGFLDDLTEMSKLAQSYEVVILLETLANLPPDVYEQFFFDNRRLDTPEHARQLHQRLLKAVKAHPCHFVIPAHLTELKKTEIVVQILTTLRELLLAGEDLYMLKERVKSVFKGEAIFNEDSSETTQSLL